MNPPPARTGERTTLVTQSRTRRAKFTMVHLLVGMKHWRSLWRLWSAPLDTPLGALLRARPEIWGMLQAPFVSCRWTTDERFARIVDHCATIRALGPPFDIHPHEFVDLLDLAEIGPDIRLMLDCPRWFIRDGLLVISLWSGPDRVFSLAFVLGHEDGRLVAFVGGIQGRRDPGALERYRVLTKASAGLRPPDLLMELFRMLCGEIGVTAIRCVSDRIRHQRSLYYLRRSNFVDPVHFNYDALWRGRGGDLGEDGFFDLPVAMRHRAKEDIPARKRPLYRRRREMLEAIRMRLTAVLRAPAEIVVQEHEPVWI